MLIKVSIKNSWYGYKMDISNNNAKFAILIEINKRKHNGNELLGIELKCIFRLLCEIEQTNQREKKVLSSDFSPLLFITRLSKDNINGENRSYRR